MRNCLLLALVLTGLAVRSRPLDAQHPEGADQTPFRSRTDLVPIDVSVLDNARHPVRGLTAADFTLLVDGKPRPIIAFSEVRSAGTASTHAAPPPLGNPAPSVESTEQLDEGRLLVILMDASIPNGAPMVTATRIAHAAIDQLSPGDLAAVVRSSVFSGNGHSHEVTSDRERLKATVDSSAMGTTDAPTMTMNGLVSGAPVPGSLFQTQLQCEILWNIARAMGEAPRRRKVVIFVGSQLALGGDITVGGERRNCRDDMMRALIDANVTVHVVDPVGVLTAALTADRLGPVSPAIVQSWSQQNQGRLDTLRVLTGMTGGRAILNDNAPETSLPALFEESATYYLLGFDPALLAGDKPRHAIRVEVKRRGTTVHSRATYNRSAVRPPP